MKSGLAVAFAILLSVRMVASDAASAVDEARRLIAARTYPEAVTMLQAARRQVEAIADPADRARGLAAIHFYSAVAQAGLGSEEKAREHLVEFFRLTPNARIDPSKYDPSFVAIFERTRSSSAGAERFESLYPGFGGTGTIEPETSDSRAVEILGSNREKREWRTIKSSEVRESFMKSFWQQRDPTPETNVNEFRETFVRRVVFAETAFASAGETGSLTDRGRVFAILGEPALVRRRALSGRDNVEAFNRGSVGIEVGTVEYWIYNSHQLPVAQAKPAITFRFVSHQGVGDFVLQKDGIAINTLTAVTNAASRE